MDDCIIIVKAAESGVTIIEKTVDGIQAQEIMGILDEGSCEACKL